METTFVMGEHSLGDLHVAPGRKVARGRLQEDDGLLRDGVFQLLGMLAIVTANGHNLDKDAMSCMFTR